MKRLALVATVAFVAAGCVAAMSARASAEAVVTRETITSPFSDTGLTDACHPGTTGTISGTATVSSQTVQTRSGFHVAETEIDSGRINWSDGSYTIIGSTDHRAFDTTAGTTVFADAHLDFGNNYSPSGVFLFRTTFHATSHLTVTNGVAVRVAFDFNRNHVFGSDCTP